MRITQQLQIIQNKFHENLKCQKQGLIERMNRIESIINAGKSFDHSRKENYTPTLLNSYSIDNHKSELSPSFSKRSTISPIPSSRINIYDNLKSQKIDKKCESKTVIKCATKEPLTFRMHNYEEFLPYKRSDKNFK